MYLCAMFSIYWTINSNNLSRMVIFLFHGYMGLTVCKNDLYLHFSFEEFTVQFTHLLVLFLVLCFKLNLGVCLCFYSNDKSV